MKTPRRQTPLLDHDFQVIAIDPGGSSGWAAAWVNPAIPYFHIEYQGGTFEQDDGEHHQGLYRMIEGYVTMYPETPTYVVSESFTFRQDPASANKRTGLELISREYIGVLKLVCFNLAIPALYLQTPSAAKNFVSDKKLQQLQLFKSPAHPHRHMHDAYRHLIYYLVNTAKVREPITDKFRRVF